MPNPNPNHRFDASQFEPEQRRMILELDEVKRLNEEYLLRVEEAEGGQVVDHGVGGELESWILIMILILTIPWI